RWPQDPAQVEPWRQRWSDAFIDRYGAVIQDSNQLIQQLAFLAGNIRKRARDVLDAESEHGPMRKLFAAVRGLLIHDMSEDQFADMYAQTVSYGLLSASFSRQADLTPQNLVQLTAVSNPFLENLLESLFRLNHGKFHFDVDEVGINDVLDLLRNTNIEAIKAAFNDLNPAEDPVIRFYEGFLRAYDSEQRIKRGVFFTPRPVVSYIVRSVHELLQKEFGLEDGLASTDTWANVAALMERRRVLEAEKQVERDVPGAPSSSPSPGGEGRGEGDRKSSLTEFKIPDGVSPDDPFVLILDIATGTATFLHECIEVIERTMKTKWARALGKSDPESPRTWRDPEILARWRDYVPNHLLPRLYGFEIMMAPYAIAHLKLALKLGETGYQFRDGDRLHIYLTNTLEPPSDIADAKLADLFGPLAREAQEVNRIKRTKRFTVVIGNPPYAGHSANKGEWICRLVDDYYLVDGKPLAEKNPKWLQDDYVKFLRYAQHSLTEAGVGILGFITNHSFIDNPTFRGMRHSLLCAFSALRILDLHGNSKKKECAPDGSSDQNVFDIQQGVSISLHSRLHTAKQAEVAHSDLYGLRERKYDNLQGNSVARTTWQASIPSSPFYLLMPQDVSLKAEYEAGVRLPDAMPVNVLGFQSHRDHFAVDFDRSAVLQRIRVLREPEHSDAEIRTQFGISDNRDWQLASARAEVRADRDWEGKALRCAYRPFDFRYCYFSTVAMDYPRREMLDHVAGRKNLCMNATRQTKAVDWRNAVASDIPSPAVFVELKDGSNVFPLWLYPERGGLVLSKARRPNFSGSFLSALAVKLRTEAAGAYGVPSGMKPEDIFHYAYAVFHSPEYRRRYAEFLRIDFPRLPLTSSLGLFRALACLGRELVALHLLEFEAGPDVPRASGQVERKPSYPQLTEFIGGQNPEVEKVSWFQNTVWLDKAQGAGFKGVREDVWNFHIGGYQVCEKWLKDRKGRTLTKDDLAHYQKIVVALSETIRLMADIDAVIDQHGGWPIK
ncbi:MAG: type ISP restriction/modification enzyme, partial [Candidatus Bathyarchaeia archaeon]